MGTNHHFGNPVGMFGDDGTLKVQHWILEGKMLFELGTVLTVTTGKLLTAPNEYGNGIEELYKLLDYMTGDSVYTHQLARFSKECIPSLFEQYPFLKEITGQEITRENCREWLSAMTEKYGEYLNIVPITDSESHKEIDAVQELVDMVGEDRVFFYDKDIQNFFSHKTD